MDQPRRLSLSLLATVSTLCASIFCPAIVFAEPPTRLYVAPVTLYSGSLAPMDANVVRIQLATRLMRLPGVVVVEAAPVETLIHQEPNQIGCSDMSERCLVSASHFAGVDVVVKLNVDVYGDEITTSLTLIDTDHSWSQRTQSETTEGHVLSAMRENLAEQVDTVEDWLDDGPDYRWRSAVMYPDSFWSGFQIGWIPWGAGEGEIEGSTNAKAKYSDDTIYSLSLLMFYHFDVVSFGFAFWWFPSVGVELDNPSDLAPIAYSGTVLGASSDDELDYNAVIEFYGEPGRWFGLADLDDLVLVLDAQGGFTHWIGDSDSENALGFNVGAGLGIQVSPDDVVGLRLSGRYQYVSVEQDRDLGQGTLDVDMVTHRAMVVFTFVGTD